MQVRTGHQNLKAKTTSHQRSEIEQWRVLLMYTIMHAESNQVPTLRKYSKSPFFELCNS